MRWYLRYGLSYRDVEELLAERGVIVDHVTVYRWVQTFTFEFIDAAHSSRHAVGDRWFADETYVKDLRPVDCEVVKHDVHLLKHLEVSDPAGHLDTRFLTGT